ncbi:MAG: MmcB family DNA repair protein [Rhodomicrobium sp.]
MVTSENASGTTSLLALAQKIGRCEPKPLRGAVRLLESLGHGALVEFPLKSGRRADILSLSGAGEIWIVEVKSGVPDFRADHKWQDYLEWCDRFFFAVGPDFPAEILPGDAGLFIADEYEAMLVREPAPVPLSGARRKALTLRFAHIAARRLSGLGDLAIVSAPPPT